MSTENQAHLIGPFRRDEKIAAGAITPGMLIELDSSDEVQAHSSEGGDGIPMFAEVDALQGNTLDTDYAADDLVSINIEGIGSECQAFLQAGQTAVIDSELISGGDGTLIVNGQESSGVTVDKLFAIAREAKDLSGSGAVDTLIRVLIV